MAFKQTIAFIGERNEVFTKLINKLVQVNYPLLLIADKKNLVHQSSTEIRLHNPNADIELVECAKNACWEADIVMLVSGITFEEELLEKIKIVATQKIVVYISDKRGVVEGSSEINLLQRDLPYSKIIHVVYDKKGENVNVLGKDSEAVKTISTIFINAGYRIAA